MGMVLSNALFINFDNPQCQVKAGEIIHFINRNNNNKFFLTIIKYILVYVLRFV